MDDIFSQFFGGGFGGQTQSANQPRRGRDRFMTMTIDFMEAVFGTEKTIKLNVEEECHACSGSGAHSSSDIKTCGTCHGSGHVTTQQRTPFGVLNQEEFVLVVMEQVKQSQDFVAYVMVEALTKSSRCRY